MKAKVNKNVCIGCGACTFIAKNVFELDDDGLAKAIQDEIKEEDQDEVKEASESCPTGAIEITEENK